VLKNCFVSPDPKVINAIKWSRGLDRVFIDNYNRDPTLSWQFFGSSAGFMRQYPGDESVKMTTDFAFLQFNIKRFNLS
jgi:hypothetical protein